MPVQLTYPGVYVQEISSGVRTIIGVATSITAFIGRAPRGPANEPVIINSYGDFDRNFGGLKLDYPMSYSVRDFFLNGGTKAIIVRLVHPNADEDKKKANDAIAAAQKVASEAGKGATVADVKANADAANTTIQNGTNPAPTKEEKDAAKAVADAVDAAASVAGAKPEDVKKAAIDAAAVFEKALPSKASLKLKTSTASPDTDPLILEAISEGSWGNNLRARVEGLATLFDPQQSSKLFNLTIRDMDTGVQEIFLNVAVEKDNKRSLDRVLENESSLVRVQGSLPSTKPIDSDDGLTDSQKNATPPFSPDDLKTKIGIRSIGADNGSDGGSVGPIDFTGHGLQDKKWGLYALDKADLFNPLCVPPDTRDGDIDPTLLQNLETYCKDRRALFIVDPQLAWGQKRGSAASDAIAGLSGLGITGNDATNAAIYFPRVRQIDPLSDGQIDTFVPCGIIAGVMARTDTQRGVWKAPAGLDASLNGIVGLQVSLNDAENGMLNPLGINVLRDFGILGRVVWGARTMRGADQFADDWKYIPVRRTALFIEESLFRGLQWVVFEPNDEPLWAQIRLNVGAFMHDLFVQGAFQGTTPQQAYFVKCDKETTTQSDINKGIVNIVVGFAPLKPAEFVVITLQQMAGQIQT